MDNVNPQNLGLSTSEALDQLYKDIEQGLKGHEVSEKSKNLKSILMAAFDHRSTYSTLSWHSLLAIFLCVISLFISYLINPDATALLYQAFLLLFLLAVNTSLVLVDCKLRHLEVPKRVRIILDEIQRAKNNKQWMPENYPHLCSPYSPCITLQWTYRDKELVNLPWALLVKGDVVLIRPGQISPGHCEALDTDSITEYPRLHPREVYGPSLKNANESITAPKTRRPLQNRLYRILETPYLHNLTLALEDALNKPGTRLNRQRHLLLTQCVQSVVLPVCLVLVILVNLVRYVYLVKYTGAGDQVEMFLIVPVATLLPLLPVLFPVAWIIMNNVGNARLRALFDHSYCTSAGTDRATTDGTANNTTGSTGANCTVDPFDDADTQSVNSQLLPQVHELYSWRDVWNNLVLITCGTGHIMSRTANMLHVLGSVTALCCVDKKGILSWPNPTAEKVFFLHNAEDDTSQSSSLEHVGDINTDTESVADQQQHKPSNNNISGFTNCATDARRQHTDFRYASTVEHTTRCTVAEVLDLTHDHKDPFKLHFDDQEWNKYISSLKPLGLAILLNTCNLDTQEHYAQFCSHVTCEAMYNENLIPVTNRRCLCELAKQIGFSDQAQKIFKLEQQLSTFRHLQPETVRKDKFARSLQLATKLKFPFPHMMAVIVKELSSGAHQLLSQGTADIILDSCVDYWDGRDLCLLTSADRKRVQDFYQRTSLTAYCTAFAYRPLNSNMNQKMSQVYVELPSDSGGGGVIGGPCGKLLHYRRSPNHCKSVLDTRYRSGAPLTQFFSTDSLLYNDSASTDVSQHTNTTNNACGTGVDGSSCYDVQCNQVFIGMVTMQYQAQADMVHLIEQLERACIRFVHFSKENELRSRVFSEKMGLESGWNCHISLLSERTRRESGPSECWANNGTARVCSPGSMPRRKHSLTVHHSPTKGTTYHSTATNNERTTGDSNLEQSRTISFSAPSAINLDHSTVKFDPDLPHPPSTTDSGEGLHSSTPSSNNSQCSSPSSPHANTTTAHSPAHEHWQSLSCLTDSTEQSAPVHFDMSNRAKLPRGIDKIRPHIEQIDNVPLLVSLFTDCTPTVIREMLQIMQDFGEVVCVMCSSANSDNMGVCLQADTSIAVEPLYPQVCQRIPAYLPTPYSPSPIELSRALNSLASPLSVRREDQPSSSLYQLITLARHHVLTVWCSVQYWVCCSVALTSVQLLGMLLQLPPLLTVGQVIWMCALVVPILSAGLLGVPVDRAVMKMPVGKRQCGVDGETLTFVLWCYGSKFLPCIVTAVLVYAGALASFCSDICATSNCTCSLYYLPRTGSTAWAGWAHHPYSVLAAQHLVLVIIVLHFIVISVSFVHRQHPIWRKGPQNNILWLCTVVFLIITHTIYVVSSLLFEYTETQRGFQHISYIVFIFACLSLVITFVVTEFVKYKEIKANLRYQRRARLDFGTKLGMNSPF